VCDEGTANNTGAYGHCLFDCSGYGAVCGDGIVDVANNEQCDLCTVNNDGAYGGCNADCTLAIRCGDSLVQSAYDELCDDGNTSYGDGCTPTCLIEAF
jgi:cysteine-rich repeat protein